MATLISSLAQSAAWVWAWVDKYLNLSLVSFTQGNNEARKDLGVNGTSKSVIMINQIFKLSKDREKHEQGERLKMCWHLQIIGTCGMKDHLSWCRRSDQ